MAVPSPKGLLIDTTRCIGCRGCQVACKQWNRLPVEVTRFSPDMTSPGKLSAATWTHIGFSEAAATRASPAWDFVKRQCLHCAQPACAAVCPVGAFRRTREGAIVHDEQKCMGCRYCMLACPFQVPKFEWDSTAPLVKKCTLCYDRLAAGQAPVCAQTCPTGATKFGERAALLSEAESRLQARPGKYVQRIYGRDEVGGTAVLYLSDVPFVALGFRADLGVAPLPAYTWSWLTKVPGISVVAVAALAGLWQITKRRIALQEHEEEGKKGNQSRS